MATKRPPAEPPDVLDAVVASMAKSRDPLIREWGRGMAVTTERVRFEGPGPVPMPAVQTVKRKRGRKARSRKQVG